MITVRVQYRLYSVRGWGGRIRLNTEAEAHAIGVVGGVAVVATRSVDIAEGGSVAGIRRTQPPVVRCSIAVV